MQQSNVIFANLFIAYFLFITLKGELPTYIALLRGAGAPASATSATGAASSPIDNAVTSGAAALLSSANPFNASAVPAASAPMSASQAAGIISLFGE